MQQSGWNTENVRGASLVTPAQVEEATQFIRARLAAGSSSVPTPRFGLILGSGLGGLATAISSAIHIPYDQIPSFARSTVAGHAGRLVFGLLAGKPVLAMQGRFHFFEGYSMAQVTFPVRVMAALGVEILIVTNAAGGLNQQFQVGDFMLLTDHINIPGLAGHNPLLGPDVPAFGQRFLPLTMAYDAELRELALGQASSQGHTLRTGIYAFVTGPFFETPAEVRYLRLIGADAVGMSTVPEVLVARHAGLRVLGISLISNIASDQHASEGHNVSHQEVLSTAEAAQERFLRLMVGVLAAVS